MAVCPFTALWREVLLLALRDADAASYILSSDFETVAALAGLDPDAVRRAFYGRRVETLKRRGRPFERLQTPLGAENTCSAGRIRQSGRQTAGHLGYAGLCW